MTTWPAHICDPAGCPCTPRPAVIEGPALRRAGMAQCIAALRIETKTGMGSRINWFQHAKSTFGVGGRTKVERLAALEALYLKTYGKEYGA